MQSYPRVYDEGTNSGAIWYTIEGFCTKFNANQDHFYGKAPYGSNDHNSPNETITMEIVPVPYILVGLTFRFDKRAKMWNGSAIVRNSYVLPG